MAKVTITNFGLMTGSQREVYVTWAWTKKYTDHYRVIWYYETGTGYWFEGSDTEIKENKESTYSAPENAKQVKVRVIPIAQKQKNGRYYWTAEWSTMNAATTYVFSSNPPTVPSVPDVEIEDYTLTATIYDIDVNAEYLDLQVVKNDITLFKTATPAIKLVVGDSSLEDDDSKYMRYSCKVEAGAEYKVRVRAVRGSLRSEWTAYSENAGTKPAAPATITTIRATSEKSIYLEWPAIENAETYEIEYTTERRYFDGSDGTTTQSGIEKNHYEFTGLETGDEYFFRVRAVNEHGESVWSGIKSLVIGKKPEAPTTWSSTTTVIVGEPLNLYWVHNSEDGSSQTYGEVEITINGKTETHTVKNSEDEDEKDKTSVYAIDTKAFNVGSKIEWRVRTAGVTLQYGDWSIQRTVDIYAPPTIELNLKDADGNAIDTLKSFPLYISGLAGPKEQMPIGYHLTVTSTEAYETVDDIGNFKMVNAGGEVYSRYFDTNDPLLVELTPSSVDLANNIKYNVTCVVSMNSGLTAETTVPFTVAWTDESYEPDAEIGVDMETLVTYIKPYCVDESENFIQGVLLSVYRREFDGSFTEISTGLTNGENIVVVDPHPALDNARYRIVATTESTGAISYYDTSVPVGEKAIIIQWDADWVPFDDHGEDFPEQPAWSGSMLRLPYNVDVADKYSVDVALINYIGREHPVTYYGTHIGETSTWNTEIPKDDIETLYALRRLARWTGDVYVREPSGSGYWASISVSFSQKHTELTIPISFDITRVEGGI